jgi:hypothetical protein
VTLLIVLTVCSVATGTPTFAPVTDSHRAGPTGSTQTGGPAASDSASFGAPSVVSGQLSALFSDPGDRYLDPHQRLFSALA